MDQASLHATEARCTQEHMPMCQSHCPLHMDVRSFMAHMAQNNYNEARKLIERHIPLPNIFSHICDHPCQHHCIRRDLGGSLAIQELESLCMQQSHKQGKGFLRPPKAKKVAVLGNGLAGLVVAYELAKKSWPVTVLYAEQIEGQTADIDTYIRLQFPKLTQEHVHSECAELQKLHASFVPVSLTPDIIQNLDERFDAIFIDVHAAANIYSSLNTKITTDTFHVKDRICAAGFLTKSPTGHEYISSSAQAGQARQAALSIERILGGIAPEAGRDNQSRKTSLHTPLEGIEIVQAILPASNTFTTHEAQAEAARCIQCECMQCVKKCVYLQKYGSFPRSYTRQIYNNAAIVQGERRANALVNGCMLCGQCTEICPERFSMAEVCLQAREDLVTRSHMPASAHAFALEDMLCAIQSSATLFMTDPKKTSAPHKEHFAFFPGCQLTAARGEQVLQVYDFLHKHMEENLGLMLSCCGTPAQWAGQNSLATDTASYIAQQWEALGKPTLIVACASCKKFFADKLSHIGCISLWEILYRIRTHIPAATTQHTYTLHDPCAARNDTAWQEATRLLAQHCGIQCEESANTKETTSCCGYGGLVWCAQPELAQEVTKQLAHDLGSHTGLASCIMCRDRLVSSHKDCVHFLDILPFIEQNKEQREGNSPPPSLSARRVNRVCLVQKAREIYGTQTVLQSNSIPNTTSTSFRSAHELSPVDGHTFLHISPDLLAELERKHILHQDMAAAVLHIEHHKQRFLEQESGHYIGAWKSGQVTFWVRYAKDTHGEYHIHDAWCHRMHVPNAAIESK